MKFFLIPLVYLSLTLVSHAAPVSFNDYKFIERGMTQGETYLRLGPPDFSIPSTGQGRWREVNGRRIYYENSDKEEAVWYGDGGSIPATIIIFKNGKVEKKDRSRAKSYHQKGNDNIQIYKGS